MAGFPSWAIALVLIVVITMASTSVYLIFRKRIGKKRTTVGTQEEGSILEKNMGSYPSSSAYPIKPLMQQLHHDASASTLKNTSNATIPLSSAPPSPYTYTSHLDEKTPATPPASSVPVKDDNASSVWTDEIKINLPLPPPSSSFFADKMELDSTEANDIYNSYLTQQQEYVSINLDDSKPFLSSAAATLQQKTATIRSTLRQSMRRKSTSSKPGSIAPLNQFFDTISNNTSASSIRSPTTKSPAESTRMSRQSSSTSSRFPRSLAGHSTPSLPTSGLPPPSPRPDSPLEYFSRNSSKKSLVRHESPEDEETHSTKIMIDTIPPESYFSLPMSPSTPSPLGLRATKVSQPLAPQAPAAAAAMDTDYSMVHDINTYDMGQEDDDSRHSNQEEEEPEEVEEDDEKAAAAGTGTPLEAASAARKIIRSASRKSRTRSMIITDEAAQAMFSSFANGQIPSTPTSSSVSKYATLRGANKKNPSDIALDIKSWTSTPQNKTTDASQAESPSPKRTLMSSNLSGSATVSGKRAQKLVHQGGSSDNLLAGRMDNKSRTTAAATSPKSLKSLFSRPSQESVNDQQASKNSDDSIVIPSSSARTSLSIITTDIHQLDSNTQQESAPGSPVTIESTSPYSSKNNTLRKMGNNVDTIRRMLQSSWSGNNLKESGSNQSLSSSSAGDRTSSYMGSVGSSYRPVASPLGSVNPRLQNQHLVSLSLKASTSQAARSRPSMPIGFMNEDTSIEGAGGAGGGGGPAPTASFSSSTVRTMIPAEEAEGDHQSRLKMQDKKSTVSSLLGSRQQNRSHQPSRLGNNRKQAQQTGKTPAQKEREKYLKSLKA
ncbi:hypothetical protein V8B55DRAFT_1106105 [Mucor lusitanicus]|uniref:Uncharacterized protein n=1 Tax=Mucor circinelloides f. lusitanicus TaxID=29924 RepID=A0A8H4F326_MUCCL|nr:hypothetical protein FB192DRAFT_1341943 [Mucor lusitanicus]